MSARTYLSSLVLAAKTHWRYFVFAWLFPLYLCGGVVVMSTRGQVVSARASLWWFLIDVLVFVAFVWVATTPLRRRAVTISQAAIWLVIVPLLILVALALLPLRFPLHMEMLTSSSHRFERSRGISFGEPRSKSMIEIKQLRFSATHPRVAQPHR